MSGGAQASVPEMSYPQNPLRSAQSASPPPQLQYPAARNHATPATKTALIYPQKGITFMSTLEDTNVDIDNP